MLTLIKQFQFERGRAQLRGHFKAAFARNLLSGAVLICSAQALCAAQPADADFGKWADETFASAISRHGASAISVALVRDGHVVYRKGYGHERLNAVEVVDPGETRFSIGSITKNFTATAVVQLLERGAIRSLDDPVNRYLHRIQLPDWNGRAITVRNLLTHRGGLDESTFKLASLNAVAVPLTPAQIRERLPPAVRPPGEVSVYSNVGFGLLALMVEDVSGLTCGEYLRRNVFVPLGMAHSFIRYEPTQPIAEPVNYLPNGAGEPISQAWVYHPFTAGSASLVSTADDMARFAQGQLDAELGAAPQLMSAQTARLLHDRSTANAKSVSGFGLSFIANTWNGTRVSENAGSGPGFQALLILLPDLHVGFVVLIAGGASDPSFMDDLKKRFSDSAAHARATDPSLKMFAVREAFLNFYLGALEPASGPPSALPLTRFTGTFRSERRAHATSQALFLTGTTLHIRTDGADALTINGEHGYRQIAENTFWKPGIAPYVVDDASSDMYVFVPGEDGTIRYVAPYLAVDVFKPSHLDAKTQQNLTLLLCLLCGSGLLALRWRVSNRAGRAVQILAIALGATALAVPISLMVALWKYGAPIFILGFGNVGVLYVATAFATLAAVLVVLLGAAALTERLMPRSAAIAHSGAPRWHVAALFVCGIALVGLFAQYQLVGNHVP